MSDDLYGLSPAMLDMKAINTMPPEERAAAIREIVRLGIMRLDAFGMAIVQVKQEERDDGLRE